MQFVGIRVIMAIWCNFGRARVHMLSKCWLGFSLEMTKIGEKTLSFLITNLRLPVSHTLGFSS